MVIHRFRLLLTRFVTLGLSVACVSQSADAAGFEINVIYNDTPTAYEEAAFDQAAAVVEGFIIGRIEAVPTNVQVFDIYANINTGAATLASAGPRTFHGTANYWYATSGTLNLNPNFSSNLNNSGLLDEVVLHEMLHAIGHGTMWGLNGVYTNNSYQYTGAHGVAAFNEEFGQSLTYVPVEDQGGSGTANAHWNEGFSNAQTGITEAEAPNRDMNQMLMTGWLDNDPFLSQTTIASFKDIGYTVVPEPGTFALLGFGGLLMIRRRRRDSYVLFSPSRGAVP